MDDWRMWVANKERLKIQGQNDMLPGKKKSNTKFIDTDNTQGVLTGQLSI